MRINREYHPHQPRDVYTHSKDGSSDDRLPYDLQEPTGEHILTPVSNARQDPHSQPPESDSCATYNYQQPRHWESSTGRYYDPRGGHRPTTLTKMHPRPAYAKESPIRQLGALRERTNWTNAPIDYSLDVMEGTPHSALSTVEEGMVRHWQSPDGSTPVNEPVQTGMARTSDDLERGSNTSLQPTPVKHKSEWSGSWPVCLPFN